jgi:predicted nucleotidyltransferase
MGRRSSGYATASLRERLAQTAAKLMMESGIEDFGLAKRKAADRLGVRDLGALPSNAQIAASLAERQRIFEPDTHPHRIEDLRRKALAVMDLLAPFEPRLVGSVLAGTATENSPIELHAFSDAPESVVWRLAEHGVSVRDCDRRFRYSSRAAALVPAYRFARDGADVVVVTFPENGLREAPLSPVDQKPMRRAARSEVAGLVNG